MFQSALCNSGKAKQEVGDTEGLVPRGPCRVLLSVSAPFSLMLLNAEGNRCGTRKGIKFWLERLIVNSAEELGFRGTRFHCDQKEMRK